MLSPELKTTKTQHEDGEDEGRVAKKGGDEAADVPAAIFSDKPFLPQEDDKLLALRRKKEGLLRLLEERRQQRRSGGVCAPQKEGAAAPKEGARRGSSSQVDESSIPKEVDMKPIKMDLLRGSSSSSNLEKSAFGDVEKLEPMTLRTALSPRLRGIVADHDAFKGSCSMVLSQPQESSPSRGPNKSKSPGAQALCGQLPVALHSPDRTGRQQPRPHRPHNRSRSRSRGRRFSSRERRVRGLASSSSRRGGPRVLSARDLAPPALPLERISSRKNRPSRSRERNSRQQEPLPRENKSPVQQQLSPFSPSRSFADETLFPHDAPGERERRGRGSFRADRPSAGGNRGQFVTTTVTVGKDGTLRRDGGGRGGGENHKNGGKKSEEDILDDPALLPAWEEKMLSAAAAKQNLRLKSEAASKRPSPFQKPQATSSRAVSEKLLSEDAALLTTNGVQPRSLSEKEERRPHAAASSRDHEDRAARPAMSSKQPAAKNDSSSTAAQSARPSPVLRPHAAASSRVHAAHENRAAPAIPSPQQQPAPRYVLEEPVSSKNDPAPRYVLEQEPVSKNDPAPRYVLEEPVSTHTLQVSKNDSPSPRGVVLLEHRKTGLHEGTTPLPRTSFLEEESSVRGGQIRSTNNHLASKPPEPRNIPTGVVLSLSEKVSSEKPLSLSEKEERRYKAALQKQRLESWRQRVSEEGQRPGGESPRNAGGKDAAPHDGVDQDHVEVIENVVDNYIERVVDEGEESDDSVFVRGDEAEQEDEGEISEIVIATDPSGSEQRPAAKTQKNVLLRPAAAAQEPPPRGPLLQKMGLLSVQNPPRGPPAEKVFQQPPHQFRHTSNGGEPSQRDSRGREVRKETSNGREVFAAMVSQRDKPWSGGLAPPPLGGPVAATQESVPKRVESAKRAGAPAAFAEQISSSVEGRSSAVVSGGTKRRKIEQPESFLTRADLEQCLKDELITRYQFEEMLRRCRKTSGD